MPHAEKNNGVLVNGDTTQKRMVNGEQTQSKVLSVSVSLLPTSSQTTPIPKSSPFHKLPNPIHKKFKITARSSLF